MKIAIQERKNSFSKKWIEYCIQKNIEFKLVNVYQSDIIQQLKGCTHFMWHWSHGDATAHLFARQFISSVEKIGIKVFPGINECWHFDDKIGQKYLLEAIGAPLVPSYVFYSKKDATDWVNNTSFPLVFKLRGGAGSSNVRLVSNKKEALQLIHVGFNKGFRPLNNNISFLNDLKISLFGKINPATLLKKLGSLFFLTSFEKIKGKEIGYIYFQKFIPNNKYDVRLIVIGEKAYGMQRIIRKNDFRASGSNNFNYVSIDESTRKIAFEISKKLNFTAIAFDFIYDTNGKPLIVEMSYGFGTKGSNNCKGYWTIDGAFHNSVIKPEEWIIETFIEKQ